MEQMTFSVTLPDTVLILRIKSYLHMTEKT